MKFIKYIYTIIGIISFCNISLAKEISFYDFNGEAISYIDTKKDNTLYLYSGKILGYYEGGSIWSFKGDHIAWLVDGILFDHNGLVIGSLKDVLKMTYKYEKIKGIKKIKPIKGIKDLEPIKPLLTNKWSKIPLSIFLVTPNINIYEINKIQDGLFAINNAYYKPKFLCSNHNFTAGHKIVFLEDLPCSENTLYNINTNEKCDVTCDAWVDHIIDKSIEESIYNYNYNY